MGLSFGFYDSINHDRLYNAEDFSAMFDGVINDGVFMNIGNNMKVFAVGANDMRIYVSPGRAWFDRTWTLLDSSYELTVEPSDIYLNRMDTVVLETDHSQQNRRNRIYIMKGSPATNPTPPTLEHSNEIRQHPLANIYVPAGSYTIKSTNITNLVGTSQCPFVTGIVKTADLTDLYKKWEDQWHTWYNNETTAMQESWDRWWSRQKDDFTDWFSSIKSILSDVEDAGDLLAVVNSLVGTVNTVLVPTEKTLNLGGWLTQSGQTWPKYQTLNIASIKSTTKPIIEFRPPSDKSAASISAYKKSLATIDWWSTADGSITFYCSKKMPTTDVYVSIRGV